MKYPPGAWACMTKPIGTRSRRAAARSRIRNSRPGFLSQACLAMAIIAVRPGSSLFVTLNAGVHIQQAKGPAGRRGSFLHRAVARGTIDSAQFYMAAVRKIDVHRHAGDLRPGDFFPRCCQEPDF